MEGFSAYDNTFEAQNHVLPQSYLSATEEAKHRFTIGIYKPSELI